MRTATGFVTTLTLLLCVICSQAVIAQASSEQEQNTDAMESRENPIELLGDDYHNSIELLRNRFRIDHNVEEITMVFFRRYGSAPVVLVRPDGSKIFQIDSDGDRVSWYDAETYDMIQIRNPVPGPWQAVGQILPDSRVMVLSDLRLHAEPLPPIIFSGEILKQTAFLTNNGKPIDYNQFRDVVSLSIELESTNNPNYNNFGASTETIATFVDNGMGMDEAPLDGVFTGQFNLSIADGEWRPKFKVSTPMFSREQVDDPLMLYPNPVIFDYLIDGGGDGYHKIIIDVQRDLVDINSLLIDGKVTFPNGDVQNFSLTESSDQPREHLIINYEYGVYRVKLTAYGKTVNGRDFILDVPQYSFLVEQPEIEIEPPVATETDMKQDTPQRENMPVTMPVPPEEPEGMSTGELLMWLGIVNASIIIIGGLVIWWMARKKAAPNATYKSESAATTSPRGGLMEKLTGLFGRKKGKSKDDADKLSLPTGGADSSN
ncbi:TIGR03503 family protein [Aestuariibacter salexigens]|uniref:TIGR03503 family protein n=1 Tax=Aestuariibacter salexigens TaxID=226010 RepID=UPI0003FEC6A5|nr:TIGR03503 family protein [Aestuariibacter salexigens]